MGLANRQKKLSKFFCPFGQIFRVELRQFQLDVRLANGCATLPTPWLSPRKLHPVLRAERAEKDRFATGQKTIFLDVR